MRREVYNQREHIKKRIIFFMLFSTYGVHEQEYKTD